MSEKNEWNHLEKDYRDILKNCTNEHYVQTVEMIIGNGDRYAGFNILCDYLSHIAHADLQHPWTQPAYDEKRGFGIFRGESAEAQEQLDCAVMHGLLNKEAIFYDPEKLGDDLAHFYYEIDDVQATLVKIKRMQYNR